MELVSRNGGANHVVAALHNDGGNARERARVADELILAKPAVIYKKVALDATARKANCASSADATTAASGRMRVFSPSHLEKARAARSCDVRGLGEGRRKFPSYKTAVAAPVAGGPLERRSSKSEFYYGI